MKKNPDGNKDTIKIILDDGCNEAKSNGMPKYQPLK